MISHPHLERKLHIDFLILYDILLTEYYISEITLIICENHEKWRTINEHQ